MRLISCLTLMVGLVLTGCASTESEMAAAESESAYSPEQSYSTSAYMQSGPVWFGTASGQTTSESRIPVRAGKHPRDGLRPSFNRVVFDWPVPIRYRIEGEPGFATLYFERPGRLDLTRLRRERPTLVGSVTPRLEGGGLAVRLAIPQGAAVDHFFDGRSVVVDVFSVPPRYQIQASSGF